ncbi:MAG: hypothetical protein ABIG71_02855 [Candidatus Uhrbacteria bacterium]
MAEDHQHIRLLPDGSAVLITERTARTALGFGGLERKEVSRRTVAISALLNDDNQLSCIPNNCRFRYGNDYLQMFFIELEPRVRSVLWNTKHHHYDSIRELARSSKHGQRPDETTVQYEERIVTQERFSLSLPHIIFCFLFWAGGIKLVYMFFRNATLRSADDELFTAPVPNRRLDECGNIGQSCFSYTMPALLSGQFSPSIDLAIANFFGSSWNSDWMTNWRHGAERIPELASPWAWELASTRDPVFATRVPWEPSGHTVRSFVGWLCKQHLPTTLVGGSFKNAKQRIELAPPWDGKDGEQPPTVPMSESPEDSIDLDDGTLHRGDILLIEKDVMQHHAAGGRFVVEWFSYGTLITSERRVKLVDVEKPETLITKNRLSRGVRIDCPVGSDSLPFGDRRIGPGALLIVATPKRWNSLSPVNYISAVKLGRNNEILVGVNGGSSLLKIGTMDGKMVDGLTVVPLREDGTLGCVRPKQQCYYPETDTLAAVRTFFFDTKTKCVVAQLTNDAVVPYELNGATLIPPPDAILADVSTDLADGIALDSRMRLRLRVPIADHAKHTEYVVRGTIQNEAGTVVVFANALAWQLSKENAACFEVERDNTWKRLPEHAPVYTDEHRHDTGVIVVGSRVRYLGGNSFGWIGGDRQAAERAGASAIGTVIAKDAGRAHVRFDRECAGTREGVFPARTLQHLENHRLTESGLIHLRTATTMPTPSIFVVSPGTPVGDDHEGNVIHTGDRVRITNIYDEGTKTIRARSLMQAKHPFTVVHSCSDGWLWLDAGEDVGQPPRRKSHTCCRDSIPADVRAQDAWWSRLCWAKNRYCTLMR